MSARPDDVERRRATLTRELGGAVTCDALTRDYVLFQRRRGHRHSTDDLLTAWVAGVHAPHVTSPRLLDLGTGIGSIGLSLAWLFPAAHLTAIEAQEVSFRLLRENIDVNGVEGRTRAILGDLRETELTGAFDLVTGSPPYFDVKDGIVSADSQRAHARFELRGNVGDYARAAARCLAPGGRFVFCFPWVQKGRAEGAVAAAGLTLLRVRDVVPKENLPPLFTLFVCALPPDGATTPPPMVREPPFTVRDGAGAHSNELTAARALFGLTELGHRSV